MGYIKTEEAVEALYRYGFVTKETIEKSIRELPSIDIVRCKECKRSYIEGQTTLYRVCGLHDITTDENNYCSWGERDE